jgi:hypothetical protein
MKYFTIHLFFEKKVNILAMRKAVALMVWQLPISISCKKALQKGVLFLLPFPNSKIKKKGYN